MLRFEEIHDASCSAYRGSHGKRRRRLRAGFDLVKTAADAGCTNHVRVYLATLWLMVLFLIVVVGVDWMDLDRIARCVYGALTLLALYIGWRGWRALQNLQSRTVDWQGDYIDSVGFTLIALFDGFVIIAALDLGAPIWLVVVIGVLGILAGRLGVRKTRERVAA